MENPRLRFAQYLRRFVPGLLDQCGHNIGGYLGGGWCIEEGELVTTSCPFSEPLGMDVYFYMDILEKDLLIKFSLLFDESSILFMLFRGWHKQIWEMLEEASPFTFSRPRYRAIFCWRETQAWRRRR